MIEIGPEENATYQSTLMNFYLMKFVHAYLERHGKPLEIESMSLVYDWANGWGLHTYELFEALLKRNFKATINSFSRHEDLEEFQKCFAKFPLGTIDDDCEFIKIDFDIPFKFDFICTEIESTNGEQCGYIGIFSEEESFYVHVEHSTIIFVHNRNDFSEYNFVGMFSFIFEQLEGMEL